MGSKSKVYFFYDNVKISLRGRTQLKLAIEKLFKREKVGLAGLNYVFCSDKRLLEINRTYLKHNYYTDIITFDLSEEPNHKLGEIYISVDRVKENAHKLDISFSQEIKRVIFHGALHLCGYKDKTLGEKTAIRAREEYYLFGV